MTPDRAEELLAWRRPTTLEPVPNQEKTPRKTFRIPPDLWEKAQVRAAERGETVTDVVIRALKRYVR